MEDQSTISPSAKTSRVTKMRAPGSVQPGDKLLYAPDECHALIKNRATGEYPWVIGVKRTERLNGRIVERVDELSGSEIDRAVAQARAQVDKGAALSKLVLVRPRHFWDATVTAVNDDGTVDVDIADPRHGSTLRCSNVKIDPNKAAHTCHLPA